MQWQTKIIVVDLDDMIDNNLEHFLDLIAERAFGTELAMQINYKAVRVVGDASIELEVTAEVPGEDEDI